MDIAGLKDVSFCETNAEEIEKNAITVFEAITGRTLAPGNPERLFLEALVALIVQQRGVIDTSGKQNLLAYAEKDFLDHLGALTDTERLDKAKAGTILEFSLDTVLDHAVAIDAGSRVASEDGTIIFKTLVYAEIEPGQISVEVPGIASIAGSAFNGYLPGQINKMVDVVPYVSEVANTTITLCGADIEEEEPFRDRIHKSPAKYSVAGPTGAYEYWAKTAHQDIIDVAVFRNEPLSDVDVTKLDAILTILEIDHAGMTLKEKRIQIANKLASARVNIAPLLKKGELPGSEIIELVHNILTDKSIRPLTDLVVVAPPEVITYDLEFTYYVSQEKIPGINNIQAAVLKAVEEFIIWQKSKIRRDINPDKLIQLVTNAGAKRLDIVSPSFLVIDAGKVAHENTMVINYGGVEDE